MHADVTKYADIDAVVGAVGPDYVIHLAATMPGASEWSSARANETNVIGTLNVLRAVHRHAPRARVILGSSSSVYGEVVGRITESRPMCPRSEYAISKAEQEQRAVEFALAHRLDLVRARVFNQTGPGEPNRLVCASIATQIVEIEAGRRPPVVRVRTLATARDFTDVRDVAAAYLAVLQAGASGAVYNICSGASWSIDAVTRVLLRESMASGVRVVEEGIGQSSDIIFQTGDPTFINSSTGWLATTPLSTSLADLLVDCRARASSCVE
jgi:GDP-4-dehydro-6-deoxy-D-mannose reductase